MRKLPITFLLLFSFIVCWSQAPFGTLGTKWTFEGWSEGSGWYWEGDCEGNEIAFEVANEITIDGKLCGIIKSSKNTDSLIVHQENDIVYFYEDSTFYKLFDYSALPGDTIISFRPSNPLNFSLGIEGDTFTFPQVDTIYTYINKLDTTTINGIELRRWKTNPIFVFNEINQDANFSDYQVIIENIGSLNGIIGQHGFFIAEGCQPTFVCYESNSFLFGSNLFNGCDFVSSVDNIPSTQIEIYPNPTNGIFQVKVEDFTLSQIEVFSLDGKKIFNTTENNVDLSAEPTGVYFVSVTNSQGERVMKKVIKQ